MVRVKRGTNKNRRHGKILEFAKGYQGRASKCYVIAKNMVEKGWQHAYIDRKKKKRVFRAIFIQRINAAVKALGVNYSQFMNSITKSGLDLNRKVLSEMAIRNPEGFETLVKEVSSK